MKSRVLLLLLAAGLAAQSRPERRDPMVSARFRALAFAHPIQDGAYRTQRGSVPLLITSDFLTGEQAYRGPATIEFVRRPTEGPETPLASTVLADGSKVILLLIPDGQGGQRIVQLPDREGDFPWGTLRFINLTGRQAVVRYGGASRTIAPNGEAVVKPPANPKGYASGQILTLVDGELRPGYNIRTFQQADVRAIYFLMPGQGDGILLKGVEERRQPEPSPAVTPGRRDASR
jgi:hypothetical protein